MEHSVFTWDPIGQRWIHERGPEMSTPPVPPDVHAIQSYFFDLDEKEWVATVLAPRGRELAAKWQGAYKIPDQVRPVAKRPTENKAGALPILAIVFAVIVVGGGAAVVAGTQLAPTTPSVTVAPGASAAPGRTQAVQTQAAVTSAQPVQSAQPTQAAQPTTAPAPTAAATEAPVRTATPRTPAPVAVALPPGPRVTMPDGVTIVYTGPLSVARGGYLPATFTGRTAAGTAPVGDLTIILGDITKDPRLVVGQWSAQGTIALDLPATLPLGQYPLSVSWRGSRLQIATITIR